MGIHDREYVRRETRGPGWRGPARGGLRRVGMWSVNTWLIVICVAVYVIDGFLPLQPVGMGYVEINDTVDRSALVEGKTTVAERTRGGQPVSGLRPVFVAGDDPVQVGVQRVQYMPPLEAALHFSTNRGFFAVQFWRLIGFQFLHSHYTLSHLLFNMVGLYFFGSLVEQHLGSKRYLAFYLLCGICGALMYVVLNLGGIVAQEVFGRTTPIPGLLFNDMSTPLIGASAGVFGVLMAGAYLVPNAKVLLFFIIPMRLRTLAYGLCAVALFVVLFGRSNAGGEAGHLGGALAGFYFIRHPHHLHGFFDFIGWVDPTSHHYRHGSGGRVTAAARSAAPSAPRSAPRAEIDRILDKVHTQGLKSLTAREKRILREASESGRD